MDFFALTRTIAPTAEPLSLAEVKEWLHADPAFPGQDAAINRLIAAARQRFEQSTGRALMPQTWRLTLDRFPGLAALSRDHPGFDYLRTGPDGDPRVIRLPRPPLQAVTSIKYLDAGGTLQTLAADQYLVAGDGLLGRIFPAYALYWPETRGQAESVQITYTAGYASAAAVPEDIKDRLLAWIAHSYDHRGEQDDEYLDRLFWSFQIAGPC